MRSYDRKDDEFRPISFELDFTEHAGGSVLVCFGKTKLICTASLEEKVPPFLRNQRKGWVTAEYGMLPGATHTRNAREAARGKLSGRTVEIGRLLGRSLRTCVDMSALGERTITVDCDVIQADGGTRTAAISGGSVALLACLWKHRAAFASPPARGRAAAISLGVVDQRILVDLDYGEDSSADVDLNLVMDHSQQIIEIQGTAEGQPFSQATLFQIMNLGWKALVQISALQASALQEWGVDSAWVP